MNNYSPANPHGLESAIAYLQQVASKEQLLITAEMLAMIHEIVQLERTQENKTNNQSVNKPE